MSSLSPSIAPGNSSTVARLVQMIRSDIRERNLRPGDRYLTTEEVAELMGVAKGTANRAMQQLARDNLLVRNRKVGTFIGEALTPDPSGVDLVCLLIRRAYYQAERARLNEVLGGVLSVLDEASVQISLAPDDSGMTFVERLVRANRTSGMRVGYLIGTKSPDVQSFFRQESLPALVMGTPVQQSEQLPSFDLDQEAVGREVIRAAHRAGRRRVAVILRDRRGFGDDLMLNAIMAGAMELGINPGDLMVRSVPSDTELAVGAVRHLFADRAAAPDAVICRARGPLHAVQRVTAELKPAERPVVISADPLPEESAREVYARISPVIPAFDQGERVGRMLSRIVAGEPPEPAHVMIGIALKTEDTPSAGRKQRSQGG